MALETAWVRERVFTVQVERIIPAAPDLVYRAWTTPSIKQQWWGRSENSSLVLCEMDVRVGGDYRYGMVVPGDNAEERAVGGYLEVEPHSRLVHTWSWDQPDSPVVDTRVTVTFENMDAGQTKVTVTHERLPTHAIAEIHERGWNHKLIDLFLFANSDHALLANGHQAH